MGKTKKETEQKEDWAGFERAVDVALKTPAKHKAASLKKKKKAAKTK